MNKIVKVVVSSQEMEQLETEYTSAQNRTQEALDSKSVKLSKNQPGFLKLLWLACRYVCMCVCMCVCVSATEAINNLWCNMV